jgi:hypothetical protein
MQDHNALKHLAGEFHEHEKKDENMKEMFMKRLEDGEHERASGYKNEHDMAEKMRHTHGAAHSHDPYHEHHKKNM